MSNDIISQENIQIKNKLPKAIKDGIIYIGNISIDCAILENGTQVIARSSILKLMGRSNPGGRPTKEIEAMRAAGVQIPVFVAANNLIPYIPNTLAMKSTPILYVPLKNGKHSGGRVCGYDASIIADICDTYLEARKQGSILTKDQIPIAATLEIVTRGLARVGISALVNEACGVVTNEKDYLQNILKQYINDKMLRWVKRFPTSFFDKYKNLYGIPKDGKVPSHIGYFINNYIYKELAPGVLEQLQTLNPPKENGRRSHAHHQFLTPDTGVPALDKQIIKVDTLLSICKDKNEFIEFYKKV